MERQVSTMLYGFQTLLYVLFLFFFLYFLLTLETQAFVTVSSVRAHKRRASNVEVTGFSHADKFKDCTQLMSVLQTNP